jgi:hypothetical protein
MNTCDQTFHHQTTNAHASNIIHTTLFDLIDTVDSQLSSSSQELVTAMVIEALNASRVSCLGNLKGYEMVLDEAKTSYSTVA